MLLVSFAYFTDFFEEKSFKEQNIGSTEDKFLIFFLIYTFVFFFGYFFFFLKQNYGFIFLEENFFKFIFIFLVNFLIIFSFNLILVLKGSGQTKSFIYNYIIDNINCLSFYSRFFLQLIRIILIVVTFFSLNFFFLELSYYYSYMINIKHNFTLLNFLFEIVHSYFIISLQISIFLFIIL